ncbi:uncharacterized protein LOC111260452 [Varroa jacobsoni]|uniref:Uncharacterized protein n=1 Tax=Varroa destructor TaxID=109461 RepID=A0A7M7M3V4_VARDE|nr:uncharacterized protein LOC111244153 [Varroa destructor]XP_022688961.1 uncharacterized protein LOC111260452 [Varroa jacobsoni]
MTQGALEFGMTEDKVNGMKNEVTIDDLRVKDIHGRLDNHEMAVIGTYVDKRVIPGFLYRVRVIDSPSYLFNGQGLLLESIGRGYGKRITFESESRNEPYNYFYSDTVPEGYAFAPVAIRVHDQLDILPISGTSHGDKSCGRLQVINLTRPQREISTRLNDNGRSLWKSLEVYFTAKVLSATDLLLSCKVRSWTSIDCIGVCHVVKKRGAKRAEIDHVDLKVGSCLAGFKLVPPSQGASPLPVS